MLDLISTNVIPPTRVRAIHMEITWCGLCKQDQRPQTMLWEAASFDSFIHLSMRWENEMTRFTGEEALQMLLDSEEEFTVSSDEEQDSDDERLYFEERLDPAEDIISEE